MGASEKAAATYHPTPPLAVGDVVTTAEQIAAAPVGTVLYGRDRAWEKWVLDGVPGWSARGYYFLRADDRSLHDQLLLANVVRNAIVMYVPDGAR